MKSIIFLFVLTFSFAAAAQKNKKPSELDKLKDTLTSKLAVIDTLNEKIEKLETELKKCKKNNSSNTSSNSTNDEKTIGLSLKTTMINGNEWVITTFGAGSPESEDRKNVDEFLQKNKFIRCENQSEWKENLEGRAYLVAAGSAGELGYYFNLVALEKLKELFLKYDEWRIATNEDFNAMFEHAASLKILGCTPFQLLAGNPNSKELKAISSWNKQVVHDIYGLQMSPYSYYSGFDKLLKNDAYVEYFSDFNDAGYVMVTHISPEDKTEPLAIDFGSEGSNYGFYIRLIKNK